MGGAASIPQEAQELLLVEAKKPVDASDVANGKEAVEEVKRLRALLQHMTSVTEKELHGLEVVWHHIAGQSSSLSLTDLCNAYQKMTLREVTEDGMKEILAELKISESSIDFSAFVAVFSHRKRRNGQMQFHEVDQHGKGAITAEDLMAHVNQRPTFADMEFDANAASQIIQLASPTGKVDPKSFGEVQSLMEKRMAIHNAFKLWDADKDGQVTINDIITTLKAHGEEMSMEEAKEILAEVDIDKDGVINFQDFKSAIDRPSFDALPI